MARLFAIAGALLLEPVAASALSFACTAYGPCTRKKPTRCGPYSRAARPCRFARHAGAALCAQAVVNAFATGSKQEASIALTEACCAA